MVRFFLFLRVLILNLKLYGQSDSLVSTTNCVSFNYENDLFTKTDRYYTQGVQLTLIHSLIKKSPLSKTLIQLKNSMNNYYGITIEQNCFTPISITYKEIYSGERPYTGTLFLSHHLLSLNFKKQIALKTQLDLGRIGNCAQCKDEQIAIHKATNNSRPMGWEYQLKNDVYLNYKLTFEKGILNSSYFQGFAQTTLRAGTIYNDVSLGLNLRFGLFNNYFKNLGIEKNVKKIFRTFVVLKSNAKAVAYNATLQGGIFSKDNVYTLNANQVRRLVYDAGAYFVLLYKNFGLEHGYFYATKEFEKGVDHGWGKCTFVFWF